MTEQEKQDLALTLTKQSEGLEPRVRLFIAYYLQTFNAAAAARLAHYSDREDNASSTGYRLMQRPEVRKAVEAHMKSVYMNLAEMKARMSEHARGSMDDFLDFNEEKGQLEFNWERAKKEGHMRNIKKFKMKRQMTPQPGKNFDGKPMAPIVTDTYEIELFDAHDALIQIGKIEGLYKEHVVVESKSGDGPFDAMAKAYEQARTEEDQKRGNLVLNDPDQ